MAANIGFEPFIDFDALTLEQAEELRRAVCGYRSAVDTLADSATPETLLDLAKNVLRASDDASRTVAEIMNDLHTTPVMVHVAGPRREETNPDDPDDHGVLQRCRRCGSVLNFWSEHVRVLDPAEGPRPLDEDEVPWWDEGELVAKANNQFGLGMYRVSPDRALEKHERECADLSELGE